MTYLWLKALHLIFMVSWFAGLFYLPRIFVNLAMTQDDDKKETYLHLLIMAKKLYRFVTPFMILTVLFGSWMLYLNFGLIGTLWMKIKLGLVASLIIYHFICGINLKQFSDHIDNSADNSADKNTKRKSHIYYRWFNEFPVIILFAIIIPATLKP